MPHFNPDHSRILQAASPRALDLLLLALLAWLLLDRFDFDLLFMPTIMTGGDSASWYQIALHMKQELIPQGRLMGWNQDNFLGYPEFQYYFIVPFLFTVLLSYLMPLTVALKIVSVLGLTLFPFIVYWALNHIRYRRPIPLIGAWLSLIFLFHERFNMFGGNALSTLAGEFSYSFAFLLQVIFMATLIRSQRGNRAILINAMLLALIGLSHAFVFMTAVFMPLYFWWREGNCRQNTLWIVKIYLLAFLFMAFWTIPMLAQIGYTTPVRMIWTFSSLHNLLSMLNYEVVLAGAAALLIAMALKHQNSHWRFFIYMALVSVILYLSAAVFSIPDIRFFPPLLFFSLMLVVDGSQALLARLDHRMLPSAALLLLAMLAGGSWLYQADNEAPDWWRWNLSGVETKPAFKDGTMEKLAEVLKADKLAPRVAWEKSKYDPGFGSDRVFESLPLFTGRRTLEGIHYSAALLSKPLSWLLGEYSLTAASPEALVYAHYNVDILPERFRMFNISEIIVRSAEIQSLLNDSPEFTLVAEINELSVFKFNADSGGYVSTPRMRPQLADLDKSNWHNAYYSWFQRPENLAHNIVASHFVDNADRDLFSRQLASIDVRGKMAQLESSQVKPAVVETVVLSSDEITFKTDSPGAPHIIKVAYSPNWHAESGESIFPVSPGLMLVYPKGQSLSLRYRQSVAEIVGGLLTATGLLLMLASAAGKTAGRPAWTPAALGLLASLLCTYRRPLSLLLALTFCLLAAQSFHIKQQVKSDYQAGTRLNASGNINAAEKAFLKASSDARIDAFPQNPDIPHAMTALAWLYAGQNNDPQALEQYQRILQHYPNWVFIHQVFDGIAQLHERHGRMAEAIAAYGHCARIDHFSVVGLRCSAKYKELKNQSSGEVFK